MRRTCCRASTDYQPRRWPAAVLGGGVMAVVLLVATVVGGEAGGLFDWLFTGKRTQGSQAPQPQGSTPLASVLLRVEGMVCYG